MICARGPGRLLVLLLFANAALAAPDTPLEVPFYKQKKNGCGAASVAMVAHYWSGETAPPPEQIYRDLLKPDARGIPLADMKLYLEHLGFAAFTLHGKLSDLASHLDKGRPIIVGLRKKPKGDIHFTVVTGVDSTHIWLNDPTSRKPKRVATMEFDRQWALCDRWLLIATPKAAR